MAASSGMRRRGWRVASAASSGVAAHPQDVVALAERAVLGEVAAGLPHEPDGGPVDRLPAAGGEEAVLGSGRGGHDSQPTGRHRTRAGRTLSRRARYRLDLMTSALIVVVPVLGLLGAALVWQGERRSLASLKVLGTVALLGGVLLVIAIKPTHPVAEPTGSVPAPARRALLPPLPVAVPVALPEPAPEKTKKPATKPKPKPSPVPPPAGGSFFTTQPPPPPPPPKQTTPPPKHTTPPPSPSPTRTRPTPSAEPG